MDLISHSLSAPADTVQVQADCVTIGGNYLCCCPGEMIDVCLGQALCSSRPPSGFICGNSAQLEPFVSLCHSAETA